MSNLKLIGESLKEGALAICLLLACLVAILVVGVVVSLLIMTGVLSQNVGAVVFVVTILWLLFSGIYYIGRTP